jgi:pimeloyl-ACP methyl ester carboxylesterase
MNAYTTRGQARIQPRDIAAVMLPYPLAGSSLAALERQRGCQAKAEVAWLLKQNSGAPKAAASRVSLLRQTIGATLLGAGERLAGFPRGGVMRAGGDRPQQRIAIRAPARAPADIAQPSCRRKEEVDMLRVFQALFALLLLAGSLMLVPVAHGAAQDATPEASPVSARSGTFDGRVDIGGRSLHLRCEGEGSPTVILEAGGFGTPSDVWGAVMPEVAKQTRVCSYDRANNQSGRSDPADTPRTATDIVADLHALLETADVPGPYVLVGPSVAGLFVRLYASTYPDDVAGLVLVDASHEEAPIALGLFLSPENLALSQRLDFENGDPEGILTAESYPDTLAQVREARQAGPLRPMPLVVLMAGKTEDLTEYGYSAEEQIIWWPLTRVLAADLSTLVPGARLIVAEESGHIIHEEQPEVVIQTITDVVEAVRDPSTWGVSAAPATGTPTP